MPNTITFTKADLSNLKRAYGNAVTTKKETFKFQRQELLTAYAKYLIEYLDSQFKTL